MLEAMEVTTQSGTCPITIHEGVVTKEALIWPQSLAKVGRWVLVTDKNLASLYPGLIDRLVDSREDVIILPPGEDTKSMQQVEQVLETLADLRLTRGDGLMALGGGVVGDLTGFCAALYMRGISWVQLPTTLLAQVDSSVGGKTGVNLKRGKNLAGAFHQPGAVWIDPLFLNSLPDREFWGGCSEVVKYAIIQGEAFLLWLENHWKAVEEREPMVMAQLIGKCISCKRDIVEQDEREAGLRKVLNVGHTAGHAIEKLMSYRVTHGEALRQGMLFELELAHRLQRINDGRHQRLKSLVERIPVDIELPDFAREDMVSVMVLDKKNRNQTISFLLPSQSGSIEEVRLSSDELLKIMNHDG